MGTVWVHEACFFFPTKFTICWSNIVLSRCFCWKLLKLFQALRCTRELRNPPFLTPSSFSVKTLKTEGTIISPYRSYMYMYKLESTVLACNSNCPLLQASYFIYHLVQKIILIKSKLAGWLLYTRSQLILSSFKRSLFLLLQRS